MPSLLQRYGKGASRAINNVLGEPCTYQRREPSESLPGLMIKVTKGKEVKDEFGALIGLRVEASILKDDLGFQPEQYDKITTSDGRKYTIDTVIGENNNKWHCSINEF